MPTRHAEHNLPIFRNMCHAEHDVPIASHSGPSAIKMYRLARLDNPGCGVAGGTVRMSV